MIEQLAMMEPISTEPEQFADLVTKHQSMVFGIAVNFLRDAASAEDIAQDVFLELYRNLGRIESGAHLVHWLRQVTSRKSIDYIRWRRLRPKWGLDEVPEPAAAETPRDPLESRSLKQMVASLPARMRMAVVLRYQEEMDVAEIAKAMETTPASVKSMVHRGLEILRSKMRRLESRV